MLRNLSRIVGLPFGSIKSYPEIAEVFSDDLNRLAEIVFPICSIDLSFVDKKLSGIVYLLQFNEDPYNEETKKYFNQYCKYSCIGFSVDNGKYKFLTDLNYFNVRDEWKEWLLLTKQTFEGAKKAGNKIWINLIAPGGEPRWVQEDETPQDPDGNPMTFIAQFDTGKICKDSCEKEIYLFYSDKHKLAVQIYQIT